MKEPLLPIEYKRKITEENISKAKKMLEEYSERYVALRFGVSRGCIRYHCVDGAKEYQLKKTREWEKENLEKSKEWRRKANKKRYHLKNKLFPQGMKQSRAEARKKMNWNEYMRNYRRKKIRIKEIGGRNN